jgi:phosphopantetheinyl transferase
MSARNGERARFHRNRKRRVTQRMRLRALLAEILKKKSGGASSR